MLKNLRNVPIRRLFLFLMVIVMTPTTLLVSYLGADALLDVSVKRHYRDAENTLLLRSSAVNAYLNDISNNLVSIANAEGVGQYLAAQMDGNAELSDTTKAFLNTNLRNENYVNLFLVSPDARVLYADANAERWQGRYLLDLNTGGDSLLDFFNDVFRLEPGEVGKYYFHASHLDRKVGIFVTKVHGKNGRVNGFVVSFVCTEALIKVLSANTKVDKTGINYIFEERAGNYSLLTPIEHWNDETFQSGYTPAHTPQYWQDAVRSGAVGGQGEYRNFINESSLVVFKKIPVQGLNWYMVSLASTDELFGDFYGVMQMTILYGLGICVSAVVLFNALSSRFAKKLKLTEQFAQRIKKKQFDGQLEDSYALELSQLNRTMNLMASQLRFEDWNKNGRLLLEDKIRDAQSLPDLGYKLLHFLADYVQMNTGALYLYDEQSQRLSLSSRYAYSAIKTDYALGEGTIGQAMKDKRIHFFGRDNGNQSSLNEFLSYDIGGEKLRLSSALVLPLYTQDRDLGVMVLSFCHELVAELRDFVLSLVPLLTVKFSEQYRGDRIALLLEQAQATQAELTEANEKLLSLSNHDDLTGMYNKRKGKELLAECWQSALNFSQPISILVFDIDHFKAYNDSYGHAKGDTCIRDVAEAVMGVAHRKTDFFMRFGGEEFVLVLPNAKSDIAARAAHAIKNKVEELRIAHSQSIASEFVTVSVGGTTVYPNELNTLTDAFQLADDNLYKAKHAGRNCVCVE